MKMESSRRKRIPGITVIVAVAVLLMAVLASSSQTSAGDGLKIVRGWIWDDAGNNVTGASVVVNIIAPDTSTRATDSELSDADGWYSITFGPSDWEIGDTIQVICTYESSQEDEEIAAISSAGSPYQYVNITFPFEIPQFGSLLGTMITVGAVGAVGAIFVVYSKRRKED